MRAINLVTSVPGPKSLKLLKKKKNVVSDGIATPPVFIKKAQGSTLIDVDGNTLIDFSSGISATNCGHGNKEIIRAIQQQAERFLHTCFPIVGYEGYLAVCEKLNAITPGSMEKKTALFNSGAEAVENAVKIARKYTGKPGIVSFDHGFHGRTLLTMSLTSKVMPYKFGFGPFAPETYKLPYPYLYRKPEECASDDEYVDYLIEDIEENFFKGVVDPESIAAIVIELVAGEGGFIVAPQRYVKKLSALCKKNDILLIVDEVQTGFGRTGALFASEIYGITPDIITMAKSLSNGLPLSAVTGRKEIMDAVQENGLGGTFCGNPVSCAASLEAMNAIIKNKLWKNAQVIHKVVMKRFKEIQNHSSHIGDVRGLGAMCAVEIVKNKKTKEPDKEETHHITKQALSQGLVVLSAGVLGNDIRTLMPLTTSSEVLNEGLDIVEHVIR